MPRYRKISQAALNPVNTEKINDRTIGASQTPIAGAKQSRDYPRGRYLKGFGDTEIGNGFKSHPAKGAGNLKTR